MFTRAESLHSSSVYLPMFMLKSMFVSLDIQIPSEKVFQIYFPGPNTFSAGVWMSRDFQTFPVLSSNHSKIMQNQHAKSTLRTIRAYVQNMAKHTSSVQPPKQTWTPILTIYLTVHLKVHGCVPGCNHIVPRKGSVELAGSIPGISTNESIPPPLWHFWLDLPFPNTEYMYIYIYVMSVPWRYWTQD